MREQQLYTLLCVPEVEFDGSSQTRRGDVRTAASRQPVAGAPEISVVVGCELEERELASLPSWCSRSRSYDIFK